MRDPLNLTPEEREAFADIYDPATGTLIQRCDWEGTEPAEPSEEQSARVAEHPPAGSSGDGGSKTRTPPTSFPTICRRDDATPRSRGIA